MLVAEEEEAVVFVISGEIGDDDCGDEMRLDDGWE